MKPTMPNDAAGGAGWFSKFAGRTASLSGHPVVFGAALLSIVAWAAAGPFAGYSDVWQLTINTGTTIVTFLMVFLIQNTQNRDTTALQIKLDELIRATEGARNRLIDLENRSEKELEELRKEFCQLARSDALPPPKA